MDIGASNSIISGKVKKSDKSRRVWSIREEEVLIQGLKEAIKAGFKSENGFRAGYLVFLEEAMRKVFPATDLRGNPHINSKIHVWKKTHGTLVTLLSRSGVGWNETDKTIDVSNEAWDAFLKSDNSARTMRYKSWPYFNDWCEIFGNDRATGEQAESLTAAVHAVLNISNEPPPTFDAFLDDIFHGTEEAAESISVTNQPLVNASGSKALSGKKRKHSSQYDDLFVDAINNFTDKVVNTLSEIVKRGGRDDRKSTGNKEVFESLGMIPELTINERVVAASLLVNKPSDLELFYSLPDEARLSLVRWLLNAK